GSEAAITPSRRRTRRSAASAWRSRPFAPPRRAGCSTRRCRTPGGSRREHAASWPAPAEVELVPSADPVLMNAHRVVTSDSVILDGCESWFNLGAFVVASLPDAWILQLQP